MLMKLVELGQFSLAFIRLHIETVDNSTQNGKDNLL